MDDTNDLIMTAARGYDWPLLRVYANSLVRTGFRGTRLMLVQDITPIARQNLLNLGFILVDFNAGAKGSGLDPVSSVIWLGQAGRYVPAAEFLKDKDFRYVVWADVRDVIFQTNPSLWLEKHLSPYKLLGCTEGLSIGGEYYNDNWLKQASYPDTIAYETSRNNDICCSGTIAGEASAVKELLCDIGTILTTSPNKPDYAGGMSPMLDQGVWNYLRYTKYKDITRNPEWSEGFCATINWYIVHRWAHDPVPEFKDGVFYPRGKSYPFCMVHQYDRDPIWKSAVESRYADKAPLGSPILERPLRWSGRK